MPIGQTMRSITSSERPRALNRLVNFARLVAEPIRPKYEKSLRQRIFSHSVRSSAWLWVMTRNAAREGARSTAYCGASVHSMVTFGGRSRGNCSARLSTQVIRHGSSPSIADQRLADMAGAEQHDVQSGRADRLEQHRPVPRLLEMRPGVRRVQQRPRRRDRFGLSPRIGKGARRRRPCSRRAYRPRRRRARSPAPRARPGRRMPRAPSASRRWPRKSARTEPPPCRRSTARATVPRPNRHSCAADAPPVSIARAVRSASYSSWPPPMVPKAASSVTTILVPASRGTEPRVAATVTRTQGVPDAHSRASTDSQSVIRHVSPISPGLAHRPACASADMTDHRSPAAQLLAAQERSTATARTRRGRARHHS